MYEKQWLEEKLEKRVERFQQTLTVMIRNLFLGDKEPLKVFDARTDLRCQCCIMEIAPP